MTVEYDLVIIGGTAAGRYAALNAANLQARVALVEPPSTQINWLGTGFIYTQAISQVGQVKQQLNNEQVRIYQQTSDSALQPIFSAGLAEANQWAETVVSTLSENNSFAVLAAKGIDVIFGKGEFCRKPHLAFVVNDRYLRSRAYLIATGSRPDIPNIDGIDKITYRTPIDIIQMDITEKLPSSWVIIGGSAIAAELAQTLKRLGNDVILAVSSSHILPKEDPEAALLVQAQLEAEGIVVLTNSDVTQFKIIDDKKWVQVGNKAIEADEILLATEQLPNLDSLNLEGVGVKFQPRSILLNDKLQTTNPQIYVCGDAIGGYQFAHIAEYEAKIAVKNALFFPFFKVDYRGIPWAIFSDPTLARVGMTEAQARRRYGKEVLVLKQYFKALDKAVILGQTSGFCKIVVRSNGEILGATILSHEAAELIGAIALCIRQNLKITALSNLPQISATLSEIIYRTAAEWNYQRLSSNTRLQNFLEGFFTWQRSLTK